MRKVRKLIYENDSSNVTVNSVHMSIGILYVGSEIRLRRFTPKAHMARPADVIHSLRDTATPVSLGFRRDHNGAAATPALDWGGCHHSSRVTN